MRISASLCALLAACSFTPAGGPDASDDPRVDAANSDGAEADAAPPDAAVIDAAAIDAPPPIDARPIDAAPPIDAPPMCPIGYVSGYRYNATALTWRAAEADCEDDSSGLTHLVVINNQPELDAINLAIGTDIWVGVVRDPADNEQNWRWRWVTGGPAAYLPWESDQPDNASGNQLVVTLMNSSGQLRDVDIGSSTARASLCECDRMPPMNADYMDP